MRRPVLGLIVIIIAFSGCFPGLSSFRNRARSLRENGPVNTLSIIEAKKKSWYGDDENGYRFDQALLYHYSAQYKKSNLILEQLDKKVQVRSEQGGTDQLIGFIREYENFSDDIRGVFVRYFQTMNCIHGGDYTSLLLYYDLLNSDIRRLLRDETAGLPMIQYLISKYYDHTKKLEYCYVSYMKTIDILRFFHGGTIPAELVKSIGSDALRIATNLGLPELEYLRKSFGLDSYPDETVFRSQGEILLVGYHPPISPVDPAPVAISVQTKSVINHCYAPDLPETEISAKIVSCSGEFRKNNEKDIAEAFSYAFMKRSALPTQKKKDGMIEYMIPMIEASEVDEKPVSVKIGQNQAELSYPLHPFIDIEELFRTIVVRQSELYQRTMVLRKIAAILLKQYSDEKKVPPKIVRDLADLPPIESTISPFLPKRVSAGRVLLDGGNYPLIFGKQRGEITVKPDSFILINTAAIGIAAEKG